MPGKQMAIDADLSAGLIDEKAAKERRKELEDESNFFGAMDGASKFVRGDAIAGLLITFINVIGGMIIGVAQKGMSFDDAAHSYTLLTVGDGLVSQIPALIVSTAAGLLVSKAGVSGAADKAIGGQLFGYPQGARHVGRADADRWRCCPGMPMIPFFALAAAPAWLAWIAASASARRRGGRGCGRRLRRCAPTAARKSRSTTSLAIDELKIELGYGLLRLSTSLTVGSSPTRSRRCAGRWRRKSASSCRRFASSTMCSSRPTHTSSRSRRSMPGRRQLAGQSTSRWTRWAAR